MVKILNNKIVIDDFKFKGNYVYFLTHLHSDHYKGLSNKWDFGDIYCSFETGKMLNIMFPKLKNIYFLERNKENIIKFQKDIFKVFIIDANHIIGSIMIIIKSKYGNILHTGDFRYYSELEKNTLLKDKNFLNVYFDNTYLNPKYKFPNQEFLKNEIIKIIEINKNKTIYLLSYTIGKEELAIEIAKHYNCKIIVSKSRYYKLESAEYKLNYFSTNKNDSFLNLAHKNYLKYNEVDINSIYIDLSGWNKTKNFKKTKEHYYIVPYSSHSNYDEIYKFFYIFRCQNMYPIVSIKDKKLKLEFEKLKENFITKRKNSILNYFKNKLN